MPPHAYLVNGVRLFTCLQPLDFVARHAIVACPCFSYVEACISFVWILCKMKVLMVHEHSANTACLGKIWFSSYSQKRLPTNEISVFFNCQYFTIRLIFDFDFLHVDSFLKKLSFGEMGHFWAKTCDPHNSGSAGKFF